MVRIENQSDFNLESAIDEPKLQVAVDVRAPTAGTVSALLVKPEDVVAIGQVRP
jgi:biotin carboxyl carrier protein